MNFNRTLLKKYTPGEEKAIKDPALKTPTSPASTAVRGGFGLPSGLKRGIEWVALLALIISTLGLILSLQLPAHFWQSIAAYLTLNFDAPAAAQSTPLDSLKSPAPLFPLVMLVIWLLSAFTLLFLKTGSRINVVENDQLFKVQSSRFKVGLFVLCLIIVLAAGWAQRAAQLLPDGAGRFPQPNYDEMVYYAGSALFASGHPPYRDFFTAHPPGVYLTFAALFKLLGLQAGGVETFLAGRWFSVVQGLLTVAGVFWAAGRLWAFKGKNFATGAAFVAALLYALDGRASEIAVLENVSNLCAVGGFICFVEGEQANAGSRRFWLVAAGGLAAAATLSKLPGLALIFALLVYLLYRRDWRALRLVGAGFVVAGTLIEAPFLVMAGPGEVLRHQVFFQMLRPQEIRPGLDEVARIAAYPEASLTIFMGGLSFALLAWLIIRRPAPDTAKLLIPALWSVPLFVIFIFSKSFHPWYYVQWALPLSLLAGGLGAWAFSFKAKPLYRALLPLALILLALPLLISEYQTEHKVDYDRVYIPTATALKSEVRSQKSEGINSTPIPDPQPPTPTLFALDPGYPLVAGFTPAKLPDGKYLIDGSSYLLYLNLNLDRNSLSKILGQALGIDHDKAEIQEVFGRERGQATVLSALAPGSWAALDGKIALPQLTPRSVEYIATASGPRLSIDYVTLYPVRAVSTLREWHFDNGLILKPFGLSTSFEGRANYDSSAPDGSLRLSAQEIATRTLDLRLVWRVTRAPAQQLKVFVHLIDERGQVVAQRDIAPLDEQTDTRRWQPGDAFRDVHALPLPALSPGCYRVIMGLYAADTGQRIPVEGQDSIMLGTIEVN